MGVRGQSGAIPLTKRRCTTCGRGVADGAVFQPRPRSGPNGHRPVCQDCDNARLRAMRAELRAIREGRR